jgi:hypothetical protein
MPFLVTSRARNSERTWETHHSPIPVRCVENGEMIRGLLMRRRINGNWQYRQLTDAERSERLEATTW